MPTLHIEHPISDFAVWSAAFDRFAGARARAGVRAERIQRPVQDEQYVIVQLDFGTVAEAEQFLEFLRSAVWSAPVNSPALRGTPTTRILRDVDHPSDLR